MTSCPKCSEPLGSNRDCEECLTYLVEQGRESMDQETVEQAEAQAEKWLEGRGKSAPKKLFKTVQLLAMMLKDYFKGDYKVLPWRTAAGSAFAIIYVITIFDLIPDFIAGLGWSDDLAIAVLILAGIRQDLELYCEWKGLDPKEYIFLPSKKSSDKSE